MPSIRYFNQTAPFWDFVANLESTGADHPFFAAYNPESRSETRNQPQAQPQASDAPAAAAAESGDGPAAPPKEPGSGDDQPPHHGHHGHHGHPCGGPGFPFGGRRGGGPWNRCGGPHGFRRGGGRCGGGPPGAFGGFGGWAAGGPNGPLFDMSKIAEFFASQFGDNENNNKDGNNNSTNPKDFSPPADVFDTEDAYIVHISLPGAKKEDVGVNWDADKSELSLAGVIYRPGDEDFLKTLALDERHVGVFDRKIRLGSRANPAQVDADAISARMDDGVLMVTIPKLDRDFVEVKKVDIE